MQRCSFHCTQSVLLLIHIQKWPNAFSVFLLAEVVTYRNVEEEENLSIFLLFLVNDLLNINSFLILFLFSSNYLFQSSPYFSFSCTTLFTFFLSFSLYDHVFVMFLSIFLNWSLAFYFLFICFQTIYVPIVCLSFCLQVLILTFSWSLFMFLSCFYLSFPNDFSMFSFSRTVHL